MRLSLESPLKKLRSFPDPQPCRMGREGESCSVLPGSKEHVRGGKGVSRELGRSCHLHGFICGIGWPRSTTPRPCDGASVIAREQSHRRNRGTAKRSKTKRGGTDGGKS